MIPTKITDCGKAAEFAKDKRDCTVRATATVLGIDYSDAHSRLAALGRKTNHRWLYQGDNIEKLGLEQVPELSCRTLASILHEMSQGRFVVRVHRHVFAVINGVVHDAWPQKPGRRVKMVYKPRTN